ncbi:MAG: hypothetical protein ACKOCW_06520 [Planctomycetaceae bacterium]
MPPTPASNPTEWAAAPRERHRLPIGAAAVAGWVIVATMACVARAADAVPFRPDSADRYQNFVVNWPGEKTTLCAVVRTADEYATLFHPAPVQGARKPFGPADGAFSSDMLLVVARIVPGDSGATLVIDTVERSAAGLVVHCRSTPPTRTSTFMVKQTALAWIPKTDTGPVRFVADGRPLAELDLAAGTWVAPALAAPEPRD